VTQLPGFAAAPQPTPIATVIPTPKVEPTPSGTPSAQIKIAVKKGSTRQTKNKIKTQKITLVTTANQQFSGVSLFVVPQANKTCPRPLLSFASLKGVKKVSIRIPDSLQLKKLTLELRSSTGVILGRARLATNSSPVSGVSIVPTKNRVASICKGIRASS